MRPNLAKILKNRRWTELTNGINLLSLLREKGSFKLAVILANEMVGRTGPERTLDRPTTVDT